MIARSLETFAALLPSRPGASVRWRIMHGFDAHVRAGVQARVGGANWHLHPRDNVTERLLYLNRRFPEPRSLARVCELARGRKTLFHDIGANCGTYSVMVARAAGAGSVVHAFEPNPVVTARLKRNLALNLLNADVRLHPLALGGERGKATLVLSRNLGEASLARDGDGIEVTTAPLADFSHAGEAFDVRILKIDVEGFEPQVMMPFFDNADPAVWPDAILAETEHAADWEPNLLARLFELRYRLTEEYEGNGLFVKS